MERLDGAGEFLCGRGPGFAGSGERSADWSFLLSTDQEVLLELEKEGILVFTPSRVVDGKRITCYDDRWVPESAGS